MVDMLRKAAQLEKPSSSSAAEKPASSSAAEAENPTDIAEAEAIPGIAQLTDRKVASESKSQVVLRLVGKSLSQRLRDIASVLHVQVSGGGRGIGIGVAHGVLWGELFWGGVRRGSKDEARPSGAARVRGGVAVAAGCRGGGGASSGRRVGGGVRWRGAGVGRRVEGDGRGGVGGWWW